MTHLYPDDSYCISPLSHLLFAPKTEWSAAAEVVRLTESKTFTGPRTEYHIEITCVPRNSVENDPRVFVLTTRFKELNRIHASLIKLHKQLYLRGSFPSFPAPRLLGSTDPAVVAERKESIQALFAFLFDSEVLRKARVLHELIDRATEKVASGNAATPNSFLYEAGSIMDAPITYEDSAPPTNSVNVNDEARESDAVIPQNASSSDFSFPDVTLGTSNATTNTSSKTSAMKRLFPKLSNASSFSQASSSGEDYLVHAGKLVATAQRAEQENEFELAFQCYKNAASSLIQGVHLESDMARRNAVRRKTAKYLVKAEKLFRLYLSYDGSVFNMDAMLSSSQHLQDPNIMAFHCSNHALRNYDIVGVLPEVVASRRVLLVEEKSTGKRFVMKLLEKGTSLDGRVLMPTSAPHMVQLQQFFETEIFIILLLEYVKPGLLWTFLSRFLCESETRWLCSLSSKSDQIQVADGESVRLQECPDNNKLDEDKYRGRRLFFSVGIDVERVAEMRDQSNSTEDPTCSEVLCTMGEDCTGTATAPAGDFYMVAGSESTVLSGEEEAPAAVTLSKPGDVAPAGGDVAPSSRSLSACLLEVRALLTHRRPSWHSSHPIPEPLIVHWMAQLVSWFYIMHNEHDAFIGDFGPEDILIAPDGNVLVTYYGIWHGESRAKRVQEGYSAPETFLIGWEPCSENDVWTLGALLFELITGRSLATAAPHGVQSCPELPIPEYLSVSFAATDVLKRLLCPVDSRLTLDELRGHSFFAAVDWSLYDNPHAHHTSTTVRSVSSSSMLMTSHDSVPTASSCTPVLAPSDLLQLPNVV